MKTEIPENFDNFVYEFSKNKDLYSFGTYLSDDKEYIIEYGENIPRHRISRTTGMIELNGTIKTQSKDFVYFVCNVLYLTKFLNENTDEKYPENLLKCDLISINKCAEKGLDISSIISDSLDLFKSVDTELSIKRGQQLIKWHKDYSEGFFNAL